MQPEHTISLEVRDYECDMQGIVNNAVYMNYIEHARHVYLASIGLRFSTLIANSIYLVAKNLEVNFIKPLRSGDKFEVVTELYRISKLKFCFKQTIIKLQETYVESTLVAVTLNASFKPFLPDSFSNIIIKSN